MIKKTLIQLLILVIYTQASAQVTAIFNSSRNTGCDGFTVTFTDESEGDVDTWTWNYGKGGSDIVFTQSTNPTISYTQPGTYIVSLTVEGSGFSDSTTDTIIVYDSPVVDYTVLGDTSGCAPLSVDFQDQSDTTVVSWLWDFGNGITANDTNPNYSFQNPGYYTISLRATNQYGCYNTKTKFQFIRVSAQPIIDFTGDPVYACNIPQTVNFTNNTTPGSAFSGNITYEWSFGNGNTSDIENPDNEYTNFGTYNVKLKATDATGCADSLTKNNLILLDEITSGFSIFRDTVCKNESISFTNNSSGGGNYTWYFGDGNTSNQANPTHSYNLAGDYTISLVNKQNETCFDSTSLTIHVDSVLAGFEADTLYSCMAPLTVSFTDTSSNANSYEWDFGNGNTSILQSPTNTYTNDSVFSVTQIITSEAGCTDTATYTDYISIVLPEIEIQPDEWRGCVPLDVNFTHSYTSNEPVDSIIWDFGNGNNSITENPVLPESHLQTYATDSVWRVAARIVNNVGCSAVDSIWIATGTQPNAIIDVDMDSACINEIIQFTDLSTDTGKVDYWHWTINENLEVEDQNPTYTMPDSVGFISVDFVVGYNGCMDSLTVDSIVYFNGPRAMVSASFNCENPYEYTFNADVIKATKIMWDYETDGTYDDTLTFNSDTSGVFDMVHTYPVTGNFTATFLAVNDSTGCEFTQTTAVDVNDIQADFSISDTIPCAYETVTLDGSSSIDASSWSWRIIDPDTNYTAIGSGASIDHVFGASGRFGIELVATDAGGCRDTLVKYINTNIIVPGFEADTLIGCTPFTVSFTDTTQTDTVLVSHNWNFGNGFTDTLQNTSHTFETIGQFNISLTVEDTLGCIGTVNKAAYIMATKPRPAFTINDATICEGTSVNFTNQTQVLTQAGAGYTYLWDFGDGNTSTEFNPSHAYVDTGYFHVSLLAVDTLLGCDSLIIDSNLIHVQPIPVVDFAANSDYSYCYPEIFAFTDNSDAPYSSSVLWTFGDGATANVPAPNHTYALPGTYTVSLTHTTSYGCTNTETKTDYILIDGPYATLEVNPTSACRWQDIEFVIKDTMNIKNFEWIFDNGTSLPGTNDTIIYAYDQTGTFWPALRVWGDNPGSGCDTLLISGSQSIYIHPLEAGFEVVSGDTADCVPFGIPFKSTALNEDSVFWDFADGSDTLMVDSIYHTFIYPDTFNVTQVVKDIHNCTDTARQEIVIYPLPTIVMSPETDTLLCRQDTMQIMAEGGEDYHWSPDYRISDTEISNPQIAPLQHTTYYVTVTDSFACVNNDSLFVYVQPLPAPWFDVASDQTLCSGDSLSFIAQPDDESIYDYIWTFNEDDTVFTSQLTHTFIDSGYHSISLQMIDTVGCDSTFNRESHVHVHSIPEAAFMADTIYSACYPATISFTDTSNYLYTDEIKWSFGNGNTAQDQSPVDNQYDWPGFYTVSLIVNSAYGCTDTLVKEQYIEIAGPYAEFHIEPDSTCKGAEVLFVVDSSYNVSSFEWDFNDGNSLTGTGDTAYHEYYSVGNFYPRMIIRGDELGTCDTLAHVNDSIYIQELIANFGVNPSLADCVPFRIEVTDQTTDAYGTLDSLRWTFGEGTSVLNEPDTANTYTLPGDYEINLYVYNNLGCSDTASENITVYPLPAVTTSADTLICLGDAIFINATGGTAYQWIPEDGLNNASSGNPTASPDQSTNYTVVVTDANACIDSGHVSITVQQPFTFQLPNDTTIILGDSIIIAPYVDSDILYTWSPDYAIDCLNCDSVWVRPYKETTYGVVVVDTVNCFNDEQFITITPTDPTIDVPLAFTPNNDGINDIVYVNGWGLERLDEFTIFNRWGQVVFNTNELDEGWNGNFEGEALPSGTYIYIVKAMSYNGEELHKKGTINLMR